MLIQKDNFNLDDLSNATGVYSSRPIKNYCFNYSVEGVMNVVAVFIKSHGYSKEDAYKKALDWLQKNHQTKVTVYPKNYSMDRCDSMIGGWLKVPQDFSNASGDDDKAVRNALCRAKCNLKINKTKKEECITQCNKDFPPSEKQVQKQEEKDIRQDAREDKRDTKDDLKKLLQDGKITRAEYNERMKTARDTKRDTVKEDGGGKPLARAFRGVVKVNPLTATGRAGAIALISRNASGIATRLAPALVSESEANQKFTPEAIVLSKKAWEKVKKAWRNLGGNEFKLRDAILKGYKLKPEKLPRKVKENSSIDGQKASTVVGASSGVVAATGAILGATLSNPASAVAVLGAIALGLTIVASIIKLLGSAGAKEDPYKSGETPIDYTKSMNDGTIETDPEIDPNDPTIDPKTGNWIDPKTGKTVDPKTGVELILGMTPPIFWTVTGISIVAIGFGIYALVKNK